MNPLNFPIGTDGYFQFLKLSQSTGLNADEVNQKILNGKGILQGKASSFIQAGSQFGINEIYLISHALLETGNGKSELATGVTVSSVNGQPVTPMVVYNMYGVHAFDSDPLKYGSEFAYQQGWTTPEAAIIGGAQYIAANYIAAGQDTLYKMRWNPVSPGTHQYATDVQWAFNQVSSISNLYGLLNCYSLVFDQPVYQ
jgi:mannosyl-glycoprotein endo-beta-N-acetylglucosaminidase